MSGLHSIHLEPKPDLVFLKGGRGTTFRQAYTRLYKCELHRPMEPKLASKLFFCCCSVINVAVVVMSCREILIQQEHGCILKIQPCLAAPAECDPVQKADEPILDTLQGHHAF